MGEVFLAEDTQLKRKVAVKFLTEALASDATARERLLREARSAAALDHPYICKMHEIAEIDGRTGIVMEHVSGDTLEAVLSRSQLNTRRAVEVASEVAEALDAAHRHRMVHCDLKPANVMLTDDGHVKVMDFGLAKALKTDDTSGDGTETTELTGSGVRVGTPAYMSPEQLVGGPVDERSDIFAFGVLLYELLAGVHPFRRSSQSGTLSAILREAPAPIGQYAKDTSATARVALDRLLAKDPHLRYQSFGEVRTDFAQVLQEASGQTPVHVGAEPAPGRRRTPFVGRATERNETRRWLEQSIAGHGGILLLGGEPGVGKTRLAEEVLAEGRQRGCLALTGRCYESAGTPPFMPWVEAVQQSARVTPPATFRALLAESAPEIAKLVPELRQKFPDIPPSIELPPEQQRQFLFSNFLEFVERSARLTPHVILLDDLHWADESTLLLLQHIAQQIAEMPVLIVGTYRDVDLDVARPFAEMLETLTRKRLAQKLPLGRLTEAAVTQMLEALSGQPPPQALASVIFAETEGNPFFTEEVFQHLSEEGRLFDEQGQWLTDLRVNDLEVPEGVRLVIGRRLKRLGDDARRVLTTAAIAGRSFDIGLLEALGDAEGDTLLTALEEAEAAKLIVPQPSRREVRWQFAHGLIRQTLANSLSLMRRQRIHLRIAETMERIHGANVERHASDIAHHLYQAGVAADVDKTVRFLSLAGDESMQAGAFDEALKQFGEALSIEEEEDSRPSAELRYKRGQALRNLSRGAEAITEWEAALSAYERSGDSEGIARTAYDAAWTSSWIGEMKGAETLARRGLESAGPEDSAIRFRMLATLLMASSAAGDPYEVSRALLDEVDTLAHRLDDPELAADVAEAPVRFRWSYIHYPEAVEAGRRASTLREARGELYDVCELSWLVADSLWWSGHPHEALAFGREIKPLAERLGHGVALWNVRMIELQHYLLTTGDLAGAERRARSNVDASERTDNAFRMYDPVLLAMVHLYAGEWAAARSQYDTALRLNFAHFFERVTPSALLLLRAYAGDDVLDEVRGEASRLSGLPDENLAGVWEELTHVVEALAVLDADEGVRLYAHVLRGLRLGAAVNMHQRLWEMLAGIAAGAEQLWDAASEHFEAALRQADEWPHVVAQPEIRRWHARMLLKRDQPGDRDKARTLLGEALGMYARIGMPKRAVSTPLRQPDSTFTELLHAGDEHDRAIVTDGL